MLFSSLAKLLTEKYPGSSCEVRLDCEISDVTLYDAAKQPAAVDCLCVFTPGQLAGAGNLPMNVVCVGEPTSAAQTRLGACDGNLVLIPDASSAEAVCYLLSLFGNSIKQQKLYSDLIYMLLSDEDLSSVFCAFAKDTDCQMLAIDISGKVLAYSKPFRVNHPHWLHSVEVGYLDKYLIEYILSYREKHNMSISPQPFILYCDRLQLFIKTIRVIYNGEIIAYAFMGNYKGEFPEFSDRFMSLIAKRLLTSLLGSRSYSSYRFNMHQNILADLIKGASEEEAVQRISVANLSFPPYMLAAVLRPSYFRESEFLHDVLMPAVSAILPNSPKLYQKGTIVALLESDRLGSVPEELMSQLRRLAAENGVLVGISNMFTRPERFAVYYRQAAQTAGFAKRQNNVSGVFLYSDCAFYLMLDGGAHVPALEHGALPHTADIGALRPGLFGQRADVQAAILLPRGLLPEAPLPDPPTRPAGGEGLTAGVVAVCWKIHPISLVLPKERRFWGRTDARTLVAPPASPTCAWRPCRTHASPWASGRPTPGRTSVDRPPHGAAPIHRRAHRPRCAAPTSTAPYIPRHPPPSTAPPQSPPARVGRCRAHVRGAGCDRTRGRQRPPAVRQRPIRK